jgi:hypothetical protein
LKDQYDATLGAFRYSTSIRNQYAHCHWYNGKAAGLFYTDLQKAAATAIGPLSYSMRHIDKPLLEKQCGYLDYTRDWLWYVAAEYELRVGRSTAHDWKAPQIVEQPPLHNPPDEHPVPRTRPDDQPPQEGHPPE